MVTHVAMVIVTILILAVVILAPDIAAGLEEISLGSLVWIQSGLFQKITNQRHQLVPKKPRQLKPQLLKQLQTQLPQQGLTLEHQRPVVKLNQNLKNPAYQAGFFISITKPKSRSYT